MFATFKSLWKNMFNFSGTTSVREFWAAILINTVIMCVGILPASLVFSLVSLCFLPDAVFGFGSFIFGLLYVICFHIPIIALTIRRIRDSGYSWILSLLLIAFVPIFGLIIVGLLRKKPSRFNA